MAETWIPRASTDIAQAQYEAETGTLTVWFQSGGVYEYSAVTPDVWASWQRAPSAGQYFHRQIKSRYATEQVG